MTPVKNFSKLKTHKNSTYLLSIGGLLALHLLTGCGSSEPQMEQVTVQKPTKGVVTTIKETKKDQYEIVKENVTDSPDDSKFLVNRLNGKTDTLTTAQARSMVSAADTGWTTTDQTSTDSLRDKRAHGNNNMNNNGYHHRSSSLSNVLWWGVGGYMLGRNMSQPTMPGFYNKNYQGAPPPNANAGFNQPPTTDKKDGNTGSSRSSSGYTGGSKAASTPANSAESTIRGTSKPVTTSRPATGRSGYFGSSKGSTGG
jgi:hypothetical protein